MVAYVDEAGCYHQPFSSDGAGGLPPSQLTHRYDAAIFDPDVTVKRGVAGAVGDTAVVDEDIEVPSSRETSGHQYEDDKPGYCSYFGLWNHHAISGLAPESSSPFLSMFKT